MKPLKKTSAVTDSAGAVVNEPPQLQHVAPAEELKTRQKLPLVSKLSQTKNWFPPLPPEGFEFADFYHL